ncbi:nuclear pore complex protein NUP107 [Selaginella moellendorffii]|uniref:nuclear pore complex protein NUP107 n=1 Tax=Selaginella moellendorffii TaxID=88036 RepID=UPI000D1CF6AD|nr:nuclear pore complex protein NUP107 [Selaginella moellendorffii]|eukprot:XP_024516056.1 nuclear pore complex protein NUP107 [Selaginella moellendorffii]
MEGSPAPAALHWHGGDDAMDEDFSFDDIDRWEIGKERQKFRRYRTRHLPSTSQLAKDLQIPAKVERRPEPELPSFPEEPVMDKQESPVAVPRIKHVKEEPDQPSDAGEDSFERFASGVDTWLHGFTSLSELLSEFEDICRDLAEAVRDEAAEKHRAVEDRVLRQKAQLLHSEASSWALLWHLYGKEDSMEDNQKASTSAQVASEFVRNDETAQTCLRLVQWLESLASKELDLEKKRKGWYAGSYTQKLGLWDQTKRAIKKNIGTHYVRHLDPDAPTREGLQLHPEDQKLEDGLLEDVWKLIRAGRITEAQDLCRTSGQAWRAASLGGCLTGYSSTMQNAFNERALEAIELDGGLGRQRKLWKWACFCASEKIASSEGGRYESAVFAAQCGNVNHMLPVCADWESAFWALVRSWLDTQIELELSDRHPSSTIDSSSTWPDPVVEQQPRDFINLFQKLYSGNLVSESVRRSCKEQHRLIQMHVVVSDIAALLEMLKTWILPSRDDSSNIKPHGHPQMIRFAAHLVLVLRSILPEGLKEQYADRLELVGDLILNTYVIFLFTQQKEELVGPYASHLAPHLCVDLYVHMMELRQNDSEMVKRKLFSSAMEYLPFYDDGKKGSVSAICKSFLDKSRELKPSVSNVKAEDSERVENLQKGHSVQWMCFTPRAGLPDSELMRIELLALALQHSNILLREISLTSLWRSVEIPEGSQALFGHLAAPLKEEADSVLLHENYDTKENYQEFLDWQEYFSCDAHYRSWLSTIENFSSPEERAKSFATARQALDTATAFLHNSEGKWLLGSEVINDEAFESVELFATVVLSRPSDPYFVPDPTVCTALNSALYLCMGELASSQRNLTVNVAVNPQNNMLLDIELKCAALEGEGIESLVSSDGGFLSAIMAAGIKGELPHFHPGVAIEVLRMDAFSIHSDGVRRDAPFVARGICRRCCLPELVLRCMQIRAWLPVSEMAASDDPEDDLIQLVASGALQGLFSGSQLEEFLLLEREIVLRRMEAGEDEPRVSEAEDMLHE